MPSPCSSGIAQQVVTLSPLYNVHLLKHVCLHVSTAMQEAAARTDVG